jgi:hypothetical protein
MSLALSGYLHRGLDYLQKTEVRRNSAKVRANLDLLQEVYVLAEEKKVAQDAWRSYLKERLFATEHQIPQALYQRMSVKAVSLGSRWCGKDDLHGKQSSHKTESLGRASHEEKSMKPEHSQQQSKSYNAPGPSKPQVSNTKTAMDKPASKTKDGAT